MRLKGKVAIVTGGNSGIGRGIVHRFVKEGANVALVGRDSEKGHAVAAEVGALGGTGAFFQADLSQEAVAQGMIDNVIDRFGTLDVVINNAGIGAIRSGLTPQDPPGVRWDRMRGCNLDAAYFVSAYALPYLAKSEEGAIVNISSTAALHGNWGLYCVAKAGIEGLNRAFAAEAAPHGVRVNGISPGWIASDTIKAAQAGGRDNGSWEQPPSLLNRMGTTDEIATAAVFLSCSDSSFITGQTLIVDGGMSIIDYPSIPLLEQIGQRIQSQETDPFEK
ncbi:MAG: SDR family NAD(P)-dependent oxidoreductase [Pseudomonadota bacterium]